MEKKANLKFPHRSNAQYCAYKVIDLLKNGEPFTVEEISNELDMTQSSVRRHLKQLWTLDLVYIKAWDKMGNNTTAVYRWGTHPDAKRPPALTDAEYSRRHRARLSQQKTLHRHQDAGRLDK